MIEVALLMTEDIIAAGDDVARDTGSDSFDNATSKGGLHYWRARNRVIARFNGNSTVVCDETDNAFEVHAHEVKFSFYSARHGIEHPRLIGSPTKQRVVDEFQLTFEVDDVPELKRLVLMHERSGDGVIRVALGVLRSATSWEWQVTLYDRFAMNGHDRVDERGPAYDERQEADLPPMERRLDDVRQDESSADANPA